MQWYHFGPTRVTPYQSSEPADLVTVYISKFNGAKEVKCDAKVAITKTQQKSSVTDV